MRDNRDPATIGAVILQLAEKHAVPICEAADFYLSDVPLSGRRTAPPAPPANGKVNPPEAAP